MRTDTPIPRPLERDVVMAMVEHMPSSCTSTGFWVRRPSFSCFLKFTLHASFSAEIGRRGGQGGVHRIGYAVGADGGAGDSVDLILAGV